MIRVIIMTGMSHASLWGRYITHTVVVKYEQRCVDAPQEMCLRSLTCTARDLNLSSWPETSH